MRVINKKIHLYCILYFPINREMVTFTSTVGFFRRIWVCLVSFHFSLKDFFSHFLWGGHASDEVSQFLFIWGMSWFPLHSWWMVLLNIEFLVEHFSSSTLNMLSHFLASIVSDEKSATDLIKTPLDPVSALLLPLTRSFSFCLSTIWLL